MRKIALLTAFICLLCSVHAQQPLTYQLPPAEILELADFERAPGVSMNSDRTRMLFFYRNTYKTLADLSAEELKLGGLRVDPTTRISSTTTYYNNLRFKNLYDTQTVPIEGLPENPRISNLLWSPDETKVAFTNTTDRGGGVVVFRFCRRSGPADHRG